jgi:DNA-binding transcriptional ArsR family regulator
VQDRGRLIALYCKQLLSRTEGDVSARSAPDDASQPRAGSNEVPDVEELTAAFRALGEPRRLRVLQLLLAAPDTLCGCELADVLGVPDYQVSRDLSALRSAGLVRDRGRSGTWIHFEPERDTALAARVSELVRSTPVAPSDLDRLALRLELRDQVGCVLGAGHPEVVAAFTRAGLPLVD